MSKNWEISEHEVPETSIKYYSLSNFEISDNPELETKYIYGNSFIIDIDGYQYFHFFQDKIGQYEFLKRYVKDLRLILVGSWDHEYPPSSAGIGSMVVTDALSIYNIKEEDKIFLNRDSAWFEKTFYANKIFNRFLPVEAPGNHLFQISKEENKEYYAYNIETAKIIRELYLNRAKEKEVKIFVSRKSVSNLIRKMKSLIDKKESVGLDPEEEDSLNRQMRIFGPEDKDAIKIIKQRFITEEDEEKLESFFFDKGYRMVDPFTLTFSQQVDLFTRVTHVASVRGSGLYNTIFCNPDVKVFVIDISNEYHFEYRSIINVATENVYEVPVRSPIIDRTPQELFSVDNIIRVLENHYIDKL